MATNGDLADSGKPRAAQRAARFMEDPHAPNDAPRTIQSMPKTVVIQKF